MIDPWDGRAFRHWWPGVVEDSAAKSSAIDQASGRNRPGRPGNLTAGAPSRQELPAAGTILAAGAVALLVVLATVALTGGGW